MVTTKRAGFSRIDVLKDGVRKGYVVSHLGAFSAFDAAGERIIDGANMMFTLRREAVAAVAAA